MESKATNKLLGCLSQTSGCLPSKKCSFQSPPRWGSKSIEKEKEREREGGRRVGECDQATAPPTSCSAPHKQESATSKSPNRNKTENKVFISPSAIEASASCDNKYKSVITKQNKTKTTRVSETRFKFQRKSAWNQLRVATGRPRLIACRRSSLVAKFSQSGDPSECRN